MILTMSARVVSASSSSTRVHLWVGVSRVLLWMLMMVVVMVLKTLLCCCRGRCGILTRSGVCLRRSREKKAVCLCRPWCRLYVLRDLVADDRG